MQKCRNATYKNTYDLTYDNVRQTFEIEYIFEVLSEEIHNSK